VGNDYLGPTPAVNYRRPVGPSSTKGLTKSEESVVNALKALYGKVLKVGCPDLLVPIRGIAVFVEVKSHWDKLTPEQEHYHEELRNCGIRVVVIRTNTSGEITLEEVERIVTDALLAEDPEDVDLELVSLGIERWVYYP
jgi:hypothetical protein